MKGHIRKRGKSSWTVYIYRGRGAEGKERYDTHTVRGSKQDAEDERVRQLNKLAEGSYVDPSRLTVGKFLPQWLRDYAKPNVAPKTYERYEEIARLHLIPNLGEHRLQKLGPMHIQTYYSNALRTGRKDGREGGLSPQTVRHHHRVLHLALKQAVRWQLLSRNPADSVEPPRVPHREMSVLDERELSSLLKRAADSRIYIPVLLAATTGMRRGEVLGLHWSDVDLDRGVVVVQRSLSTTRGGSMEKETKSHRGRRSVTLLSVAVDALRSHKAAQARARLQLGPLYDDRDLVCARPNGTHLDPGKLSSAFGALIRESGLPTIRFHDLRHTHATHLMKLNVHPKVVSERLGHSTIGITLDTYSHVIPGMQGEAAQKLDRALKLAANKAPR